MDSQKTGEIRNRTPKELVQESSIAKELAERGHGPARTSSYCAYYCCPFPDHDDTNPSFVVDLRNDTFHCYGCGFGGTVVDLVAELDGRPRESVELDLNGSRDEISVYVRERGHSGGSSVPDLPVRNRTPNTSSAGLTLDDLIAEKRLSREILQREGVTEYKSSGAPLVRIPYMGEDGQCLGVRRRIALTGDRFRWRSGDTTHLYGLNHMGEMRTGGWVLLVEGETDCWTGWEYGLPCLGVPGKTTWRSEWAEYLTDLDVFVWQEPGAEDLVLSISKDVSSLRVIVPPDGVKDINQAHCLGYEIASLIDELCAHAPFAQQLASEGLAVHISALEEKSAPILDADDPLECVKKAIRDAGYGGDLKAVVIVYLAVTGRVLGMRHGAIPVHTLLLGPASSGKSYSVNSVLRMLPDSTYHTIDAGSPRVLIYGEEPLDHRVLVFSEADSLPAGEDNPAASAVRSLLQEHELNYEVTIRNPKTNRMGVQKIHKLGPTTLVTTSTRRLGPQLESRLFVVEVADDQSQIAAALKMQAQLELHGPGSVDFDALIAYQELLQVQAPWNVKVPFASEMSEYLASQPGENRVVRDFNRLLSLIKAVVVLRHRKRKLDADGRLLAEMADYVTVYDLVADVYQAGTGASRRVRDTVEAVGRLIVTESTTAVTAIAKELGITKGSASTRVRNAIQGGWLVNEESTKGKPARIRIGDPLPDLSGLPSPETLEALVRGEKCDQLSEGGAENSSNQERSAVRADTDDANYDEDEDELSLDQIMRQQ